MSAYVMTSTINEENVIPKENLSSRLLYALNRQKISQSELARKIGVKPQVIQYLCTGNANKSKFSYEIAIALEINPNWLIAGKGPMQDLNEIKVSTSTQPKVPLLSWDGALDLKNHISNANDYIHITTELKSQCYALRVFDTSMVPRFEIGSILIIDPELEPKNGDFVIAKLSEQKQPIFRQFIKNKNMLFLLPINTALYKEIEMNLKDKILGVVRQTYYEFVR